MLDLTVAAVPGYFGTMGAEHVYLKKRIAEGDTVVKGYERNDTLASLAMGVGSLVAPMAASRLLGPVTPGKGRWGRVLVATALGAAAATTVADVIARKEQGRLTEPGVVPDVDPDAVSQDEPAPNRASRRRIVRIARTLSSSAAVTAVAAGITAGSTAWATRMAAKRLWAKSGHKRDLGGGALAVAGAIIAWDFIYYWNHRFMHESRWLWAMHVVHHSSEHYNLSTALRQPVADAFTMSVPYGALAFAGFRPELIETARGVNLLYQYWIHTEAIKKIGRFEEVLNTPSHHRVHHGSNSAYIDRNHGSILIIWDRLFGTFQRELDDDPVAYGLTKNIGTFNPLRIASHEQADILRDVAHADTWSDRFGYVFRGPGWAYARHAERHEPQPLAGVA